MGVVGGIRRGLAPLEVPPTFFIIFMVVESDKDGKQKKPLSEFVPKLDREVKKLVGQRKPTSHF